MYSYTFDLDTGFYIGRRERQIDPRESKNAGTTVYTQPRANEVLDEPELTAGFWPCRVNDAWDQVPDHRDETWYMASGIEVVITSPGDPTTFTPPLQATYTPPPPEKIIVPVSRAQLKIVAKRHNKMADILTAYAAWPEETQILFDSSAYFERTGTVALAVQQALNLTDAQLDAVFEEAATIV